MSEVNVETGPVISNGSEPVASDGLHEQSLVNLPVQPYYGAINQVVQASKLFYPGYIIVN